MAKSTVLVVTPYGTFSRSTNTPYKFAVVSLAVSRSEYDSAADKVTLRTWSTAEEFKAWLGDKRSSGVWGRFAKDGGYVLSYHGSEEAARKAADKGNSPYVTTRTLGIYPVIIK